MMGKEAITQKIDALLNIIVDKESFNEKIKELRDYARGQEALDELQEINRLATETLQSEIDAMKSVMVEK